MSIYQAEAGDLWPSVYTLSVFYECHCAARSPGPITHLRAWRCGPALGTSAIDINELYTLLGQDNRWRPVKTSTIYERSPFSRPNFDLVGSEVTLGVLTR